jgi:disulfide bond formation protein DsbB
VLAPLAIFRRTAAGSAYERVRHEIGPNALALAAAVAITCMTGSLYYSEVANFPPCKLCWYQRIAMYPLAIMLPIAAVRRDVAIRPYAMTLAGVGAVISVYHMLVERFPNLESGSCDPTNPCSIIWVEPLGYLTIPTMALSGFAFILTLLAYAEER